MRLALVCLTLLCIQRSVGQEVSPPSAVQGTADAQVPTVASVWGGRYERYRQPPRQPNPWGGRLREENISDNEVREIRAVMLSHFPGAILNIAGVTTGCPCADGATCEYQVWVVAHQAGQANGLQLSKIDGHWTVGPVQAWWLARLDLYAQLARARKLEDRQQRDAQLSLLRDWERALEAAAPQCTAEDPRKP